MKFDNDSLGTIGMTYTQVQSVSVNVKKNLEWSVHLRVYYKKAQDRCM